MLCVLDNAVFETPSHADPIKYSSKSKKTEQPREFIRQVNLSPRKTSTHRKGFFDSTGIFLEPKQTISIEGEIEKRLKMREIDETSKDLETLKQILEALQLKDSCILRSFRSKINSVIGTSSTMSLH
ncbi:unnamed protein product [Fraxinus pennsylvanica]|uniref:Uncharacterized protein n=1 Tax=Fraxinus pennsylvanica TaxID=56036 RepID=A0AAD2A049_9LAMI|nr:unnamed protein product [Fraxinus pennsylvanica]